MYAKMKNRLYIVIIGLWLVAALCSLCIERQQEQDIQSLPVTYTTTSILTSAHSLPQLGLLGEGLSTIFVGESSTAEPYSAHPFSLRMLRHYQPYFIAFRGVERRETSPFCVSVGRIYYVYALRHILC